MRVANSKQQYYLENELDNRLIAGVRCYSLEHTDDVDNITIKLVRITLRIVRIWLIHGIVNPMEWNLALVIGEWMRQIEQTLLHR